MNLERIRQWILPEIKQESRTAITRLNIWLISRAAPWLLLLTTVLMIIYAILYRASVDEHQVALIGVLTCELLLLFGMNVTRRWKRDLQEKSSKGSTRLVIELFYWCFSIWGVVVSWQMYLRGSQMMIMDTVQIAFMLLVCCYPLWGIIRTGILYTAFYVLLLRSDGAAQINVVIYCVMPAMVSFGTILRYGMEVRNIEQVRTLTRYTRSLENSSTHDELTGMKNRMGLREDFDSYFGKQLWVVMSDVDHFKRYNDTYGHETGDQILIRVAAEIMNLFGTASTYRYGGDEFLIILEGIPDTELSTMLVVWSEAIRGMRLEILPEEDNFSCSYGYAGGVAAGSEELRRLILIADQKLYEMKRKTRA